MKKKKEKKNPNKNISKNKGKEHQGTKNLIPAKKGEIRNPKGRPPLISSIPHNIREVGKELVTIGITTIDKKGKKIKSRIETTKAKALVYRMYAKGLAGNEKAVKLLWEFDHGKPTQTINLGLIEGEEVNVIFRGADFLVEDEEGEHGVLTDVEDADFTDVEDDDGDNGQIKKENK